MNDIPNLFSFATSELSQDAFISWLLAWADPSLKNEDPKLHKTGLLLAEKLLSLNPTKEKPDAIESIEIKQQSSKIDVLCILNRRYVIIIEDKTNTKHHSGQLAKYYAKQKEKFNEEFIHPIYFKTGDQSSYRFVKENGYSVFNRANFLEVLNFGESLGITSDIFHSFRNHVLHIEEEVNSFRMIPVDQWNERNHWIGFYRELQAKLGEGGWDYIPQKNGGFVGFWWKWRKTTFDGVDFEYYLQLEHKKFCFKIRPAKLLEIEKAKKLRYSYQQYLLQLAREKGIQIKKNGRVGATMTVATLKEGYIRTSSDNLLDIDETVKQLKLMELLIAGLWPQVNSGSVE